jgi:hypothetical protein
MGHSVSKREEYTHRVSQVRVYSSQQCVIRHYISVLCYDSAHPCYAGKHMCSNENACCMIYITITQSLQPVKPENFIRCTTSNDNDAVAN